MKNERRKSFILYLDNSIILDQLTDEESGKLIKAIFKYQSSGVTPDFSKNPALAMGFSVFKMSLDRDSEKYQERCERNRANDYVRGFEQKLTKTIDTLDTDDITGEEPAGDTNTDSDGETHTQEMESKKKFIVKTVEDIKAEKAINMIYAFVRKLAAEE